MDKIPANYQFEQNLDKAAQVVYPIVSMYNEDVRFRQSDAVCRNCQRDLEVYYCGNHIYAVRCKFCGLLTLTQADSLDQAANRVGIKAMSIEHDYIEDDEEVICIRYPVEDMSDVRIGNPMKEENFPEDFTHFIPLILPHMPKEDRNDENP